jgi:hypothetical protein
VTTEPLSTAVKFCGAVALISGVKTFTVELARLSPRAVIAKTRTNTRTPGASREIVTENTLAATVFKVLKV